MDGRGSRRFGLGRGRESGIITELLSSEEQTRAFAKEFAALLSPGDVVCLVGDLGAGKTTFVKGIAAYFGIPEESVSSPTFIYLHQYQHLAHFDLYRLQGEEQFLGMGFDEYFEPPFIALVEWPNILEKALPKNYYWVTLSHHRDGREIVIEKRIKD